MQFYLIKTLLSVDQCSCYIVRIHHNTFLLCSVDGEQNFQTKFPNSCLKQIIQNKFLLVKIYSENIPNNFSEYTFAFWGIMCYDDKEDISIKI